MSGSAFAADCVNGINTASCTVPAGVTSVTVKAWGGGGGGGAQGSWATDPFISYGGGGGGGSFCGGTFTVTPGQTVSISVGIGGAGGTDDAHMQGANGGTTTVSGAGITGVTVNGGSYGYAGGGAGGTVSGCSATAKYAGGSGSASLKVGYNTNIADASGGAGGSAASTANGNSAALTPFGAAAVGDGGAGGAGDVPTNHNPAILQAGGPGGLPGGGGGGGSAGGAGGDGKVLLSFAATYSVTYSGNTNTGGSVPTDGSTYANGASVTVLGNGTLTKTGYTFNGWNTAADGSGTPRAAASSFSMGGAALTLYAQWTINSYTVSFDKNTGTVDASPTSKPATYGGNVGTLPTAPTKTGYTFASWNTLANGTGTAFTATTAVTADLTVYAQWTTNTNTPAAIPTLSEWGMIMLASLMALFGMGQLPRVRRR